VVRDVISVVAEFMVNTNPRLGSAAFSVWTLFTV
jgi:hypothetical protein